MNAVPYQTNETNFQKPPVGPPSVKTITAVIPISGVIWWSPPSNT